MISNENIKLHTLSGRFILSDISFGIQSINPDVDKSKPRHQSNPHKHDSYFIKYIIEGSGSHNIDFIDYEILPHSIFFMAPGQVHSYDMLDVKGFVIYFKTDLIAINELPFFNHSYSVPVLYLKSKDEIIDRIFQSLMSEYQNNSFKKNELIRANLQSLLILMTRKYFQQRGMTGIPLPNHVEMINKLNDLIDTYFIEKRNTSFYSNALNISSRQLNNILNKNMNKSISVLIRERILVEAKRLLCYTDKTISEIAYQLNFTDKTYFHKFFKVHEKITPEVFRQEISSKLNIS